MFAASPAVLRTNATIVYPLGEYAYRGMDYAEIGWPYGEVQVFRDFRRRISAARVARREIITEQPDPRDPDQLNRLIWERGTLVRHRRSRPLAAPLTR
jgi:hypothetical protein